MLNLTRISVAVILFILLLPFSSEVSAQKKLPWQSLPGRAADISVGANGTVFITGSDAQSAWKWNSRKRNWDRFQGGLARIAVDPRGNPWGVNKGKQIWRHDGRKWHLMPGGGTDVAIGANGKVWIIGSNPEVGGFGIYRWDGRWTKIPGSAVRIAVDPRGNAWVINKQKQIYRYDGKRFVRMPGAALDIGIGANGAVWVIGTNNSPYQWNGRTWVQHNGGISQITVGPKGYIWGVNKGKQIWADKRSPALTRIVKTPPTAGSPGSAPSTADADKILKAYPKFKNVRVSWRRSGNTLTGSARIGRAAATVVAFKPRGKRTVTVGIVIPNATIQDLLPGLTGNNPLKTYRLKNVIAFLVPPGNQNHAQKIAALPAPLTTGVRNARLGDDFTISVGFNYFGILNTNLNMLAANALKVMGVGSPWTVSGGIVHTEFAVPQHSITLTAPLTKDPFKRIFGNKLRVMKVSPGAKSSVFLTGTGTGEITVGYTSTYDIFKQRIDGTLEFTAARGGEYSTNLTLFRKDAWRNPHLGTVGLSGVTLHDTTILFGYSRSRTGTRATLGLDPKKTIIRSTTYNPSTFYLTVDGATGYPKAAFVNLATAAISVRQIAELGDIAIQLTPQGQLARHGNPYGRGQKVFSALGLNKLPIDQIKLSRPKIYLSTPGAVRPALNPPPYPPLPTIFGSGVHVRGRLDTFGKTFGKSEFQLDFKGLHTDTKIKALQFGAFTLKDPRFKMDAATGKAPKARFAGSVKIGPVPISKAEVSIGKHRLGYRFKSSCIGAVKVESSGSSNGFKFKFNAIKPKPCVPDFPSPAEIADAAGQAAKQVASLSKKQLDDLAKKASEAAKALLDKLDFGLGSKGGGKKYFAATVQCAIKAGQTKPWGRITFNNNCRENIAYKKPTRQSSTGYNGVSSRAVDDVTNGVYASNSVTHTKKDKYPWWEVDLGGLYQLESVIIYNRAEAPHRLNGAIVAMSPTISGHRLMSARARNEGAASGSGLVMTAQAKKRPGEKQKPVEDVVRYVIQKAGVANYMITTETGGKAATKLTMPVRYIRIYHTRPEWLSLAEVKVIGSKWPSGRRWK